MAFEFRLPDIGEGVVEGEIVRWMIGDGEMLQEDQPMVEIMTDKATVELPSPVSGRVVSRTGREGDVVDVGTVLIVIDSEDSISGHDSPSIETSASENRDLKPVAPPTAPRPSSRSGKVLATPAVRRRAREMKIDLSTIEGTGSGGRVTSEDLERYLTVGSAPAAAESPKSAPGPSATDTLERTQRIPYRAIRRKIGDRLAESKRRAPHYTYVEEADMTQLVQLRRQSRELGIGHQSNLTYLPFFIKAIIEGLKKYPIVNSSLVEEAAEIQVKHFYNIGVAAATEDGLIVPVVKDADQKGILELADEIERLVNAARTGKIAREDLQDGTFTITSLGKLGGVLATPIINYPEVAILGIHKIKPQPVVREGQITVREMTYLSISLDHRVVDGATGAAFLDYIIHFVENPGLLLV